MKMYSVEIEFIEPLLGTVPKDKEVYSTFIKTKGPKDNGDEIETVEETEEKGWTGFHMLNDQPILYNYTVKGFFKDACGMLRRVAKTKSKGLTSYKKVIDGLIFVFPRRIPIEVNGKIEVLERPLRAQTAKGERVTVTRSDICPAGSKINFQLKVLGGISEKLLKEWFDYGIDRGFGQWRNAGYGAFNYKLKAMK